MMHTERRQKGGPAITAPFPGRRLCLSLLPVDSRAVTGQPTNSGQHDVRTSLSTHATPTAHTRPPRGRLSTVIEWYTHEP